MKRLSKYFDVALSLVLGLVAVATGGGALLAIAGTAPDGATGATGANPNGGAIGGGATAAGANHENAAGVASQTTNDGLNGATTVQSQNGAEGFDARGLQRRILEIEPMKTPLDQITRKATTGEKPKGMAVEYASIGSRPTETVTKAETGAAALSITGNQQSGVLNVEDPQVFSIDDVILVPEVKAVTRWDGKTYAELTPQPSEGGWPCLMLKVCGFDDSTSCPIVYCLNGVKNTTTGQNTGTPVDAAGKSTLTGGLKLLRVAKALSETAVQTGRVAELPKTDLQFLQVFAAQTEESTIHKLTQRDVDGLDLPWHERRMLQDMRMVQEGTFLFSDMCVVKGHPKENLSRVQTTRGLWWQAGKDVVFGHLVKNADNTFRREINEDDLVNINADLFVGEGTGNVKKVLFAGSEFITELEKIKSEKFRLKGDVKHWDLTLTSWKTTFGELLVIHCETLDRYGKSACAFSLDPEYFEKVVLQSLDRNALDLEKMGVRATSAVILKEISAVILYAPMAHARVRLIDPVADKPSA